MKHQNGALHNLAAMPRQEDRASDHISKDILLASSYLYPIACSAFQLIPGGEDKADVPGLIPFLSLLEGESE